ncbi:MAG: hypothetical protein RLY82_1831 [Pseudomonadota bacterium]|jgi:uncharacterized protein (UPF0276 family)
MFGIGFKHAHYAELLENPSQHKVVVDRAVDFLEVHSENFFTHQLGGGGAARATLAKARQHWPISLHGVGLALGSAAGLDLWHLDQLADLVERTDPLLVSDHACFARGYLLNRSAEAIHATDLLPIPFSKDALEVLCSNVSQVQDRLERTIAVENLSAYFIWKESDFSETQFLDVLTQRTGCKLLIDVNNIYVNALNSVKAGAQIEPLQNCQSWLDQIPTDVVAEIHVAGHHAMDDIVIDDHSCAVNEPVWALYRHAIQRFGRIQTLVEWDTDVPPLDVLIEELCIAKMHAQEVLA